ncbi:exonuclease sbcCD subunit D [Arcobacter sp. CECT 8986]|uniref:metallophosphoesterase family protein n=1 Tax=Arcobacter sp. CECT 8986 TaxID=2044507 RepID=UPI001009AEE9|nr:DNA repair exonuclease [Arcobacter sp. CECT 8986]RXK01362.1 exonuclease sbcCD subunit D [Arcobacter sp. CECT 8986]
MKIIHFSDTHLGFSDLDIINEEGINQREADFYKAFDEIVENIIKLTPDYIIHTGDLFHRSSPSNRAISFALDRFRKLNELDIPIILIAGNHSTPRTKSSLPILSIFDGFENIHCAYKSKYEKFEFDDIIFHALPHLNDENNIENELEKIENGINQNKKNLLMLHCSVGASYLMSEFGEFVFPHEKEFLFNKMDYVALGHWHGFSSVKSYENVYYSGSSERTSFSDKRNNKGFIYLDLSNDDLNIEFKQINIREFLSFEIDAKDIFNQLENINQNNSLENCIVQLTIKNLNAMDSINISNKEIRTYLPSCFYLVIKREFVSQNEATIEDIQAISLKEYFTEYLKQNSLDDEFNRLKLKTDELFDKYEDSIDDTI